MDSPYRGGRRNGVLRLCYERTTSAHSRMSLLARVITAFTASVEFGHAAYVAWSWLDGLHIVW